MPFTGVAGNMGSSLGLKEAVAMALGGMIGGGIYSAFGIVVAIAGKAAWVAFVGAGVVATCAGYSYVKLDELTERDGGAPAFILDVVGNKTLAGVTAWTLLFGYIGSMALYAYAFAGFFAEMIGRLHFLGLDLSKLVAILLIAVFVGLNLLGASETGKAEDVLTGAKVLIIGVFGVWGVWYALNGHTLTLGFGKLLSPSPVMAAAMSFVAFQGWQLLLYDKGQFENPHDDIRKAIYVSIPVATLLYVLVALTTVSLLRLSQIAVAPEISLLYAGIKYMGFAGAIVIGISALFSTASAVNATLFSSAQFSSDLIDDGIIPERFASSDDGEIPKEIVVVLGALSAAFAVYGSLSSITSFASLAFIAVFGGMSYMAFRERHRIDGLITPIPVLGFLGPLLFFPLLLYNLWINSPGVFYTVIAICVVVLAAELLYFEREPVEEAVPFASSDSDN